MDSPSPCKEKEFKDESYDKSHDQQWGTWDQKTTPIKVSSPATVSSGPSTPEQIKTTPKPASKTSQIDSLSRDDLVKYVKKQTLVLQKMKSRLDELTQECSKLRMEGKAKAEEDTPISNEYLIQEVQVLKSERDQLQTELKNVKQMVLSFEQENEKKVSSLEEQLTDMISQRSALEEQLSKTQSQSSVMAAEGDNEKIILSNKVKELQSVVNNITETRECLQGEMKVLEESYENLKLERQRAKDQVMTLEEELNQKMEGWAHEREKLNTELAKLTTETVDAKTVTNLQEELLESREQEERMKREMKKRDDENKETIQILEAKMKSLKEEMDFAEESSSKSAHKVTVLETEVATISLELLNERKHLTQQFEEKQEELKEEMKRMRRECDQLIEEQTKLRSINSDIEKTQYSKIASNSEVEQSLSDSTCSSLEESIATLKLENEELVKRLKNKDEVKKLKAYAVKLKKELVELQERERSMKQELNNSLENLKVEQDNVVETKAYLRKSVEDYNNVCQELQKEQQERQEHTSTIAKQHKQVVLSLEDERSSLRSELESVKTTLLSTQSELTNVKRNFNNSMAEMESLREMLTKERKEFDQMKQKLTVAEKDSKLASLMNLELADYQRSLEALRGQVKEKETILIELENKLTSLERKNEELTIELVRCKEDLNQKDDIIAKMKAMLRKSAKDLLETKAQITEAYQKTEETKITLETTKQNLEMAKVDIANLTARFQSDLEQSQSSQSHYKQLVHSLEAKVSTLQSEMTSSVETLQVKQEEFESYKVRVHSVLKQKETKPSISEIETSLRQQHEEEVLQTKVELRETRERLTVLLSEHNELEETHQQLLSNHDNLIHDSKLKTRELQENLDVSEEKYHMKTRELDNIIIQLRLEVAENTAAFKSQIYTEQKDYQSQLVLLQKQLQQAHEELSRRQQETDAAVLAKGPSQAITKETSKPAEARVIPTEERSSGEGMDRIELEISGLATPTKADQFVSFESLLSNNSSTDLVSLNGRSQTPQVEDNEPQQQQAIMSKKLNHLSELLHESEANCMRFTDQTKLLKEEIRRLERNQERQKEAVSNMEYLKNVTLKFLHSSNDERIGLIPIITRLLQLSQQEKHFLQDTLKGKNVSLPDPTRDDASAPASNKGLPNYLHRWTGYH